MANSGQATLRGRFRPGTRVRLIKGKDDGSQLHPDASQSIDKQTVDEDGTVQFTGLEVGGYYFAYGYVNGSPLSVRLRGRSEDDEAATVVQIPVQNDPVRHRDGTLVGERGELKEPVVRQAPHDEAKRDAIKASKEKESKGSKTTSTSKGAK